jgi:hypothetical protein
MSKIALSGNASGTGTLTFAAPDTNTDRTLTLPDNSGTMLTTASTFAGTGPAFSAYMGTDQSVSNRTQTKLQFNTEVFDTNSNYDPTTNYRFTPTVAGYYHIIVSSTLSATNAAYRIVSSVYKNGSHYKVGSGAAAAAGLLPASEASTILYMNGSTDYVEGYAYVDATAPSTILADSSIRSQFSGVLVRAA